MRYINYEILVKVIQYHSLVHVFKCQIFVRSNSPAKLVSELRSVINTPKRYPLFREVR